LFWGLIGKELGIGGLGIGGLGIRGKNKNGGTMERFRVIGPFDFVGENSVFGCKEAPLCGIYIWTVKLEDGYLPYYVGETGKSFAERLTVHVKEYFSGVYRIYDPDKFKFGQKKLIWQGTWLPGTKDKFPEFIAQYNRLAPEIYRFLSLLQIFLIPLNINPRKRKRIESTLAHGINDPRAKIGNFQEREIKYAVRRKDEEPLLIALSSDEKILGLPETLSA
jgi:hypothetical protein